MIPMLSIYVAMLNKPFCFDNFAVCPPLETEQDDSTSDNVQLSKPHLFEKII